VSELDERRFQIVVRRKPRLTVYIRSKPFTSDNPTPRQQYIRQRFAEVARLAKGMRMNGLPPAAVMVSRMLRGETAPGEPATRVPKWVQELSDILKRSNIYITREEINKLREVIGGRKWY